MDRPKFETPDGVAANIAKLAELFPAAVAEGKVNFEMLRTMLGDEVFGDEAYEFTWVGKREAVREAGKPIRKTLRPVVEDEIIPTGADSTGKPYCSSGSRNWDTTENLYIEGDNLDVLKLLQESYLGKVKMIYIDPPYNTGSDFVYRDKFQVASSEFQEATGEIDEETSDCLFKNTETNGRFHSDWCSMIYSRLALSRNLLTRDGIIFISIDDNEVAQLRKICDEVLGTDNFVGCFVWKRRTSSAMDQSKASTDHEYVIAYHRGGFVALKGIDKDYQGYSNPDNDPRGSWTTGDLTVGMNGDMRPNQYYDLVDPKTGEVYKPNFNRVWSYTPESMQKLIEEGRVIFPKDINKRPMRKRFLNELNSGTNPFSTWMVNVGMNSEGTRVANALFDNITMFNYAKPLSLVKNLIQQVTDKDSIVVDFFSGSATTAHAVMQLNAEDGGKRKFIMVQLQEVCASDSEAAKAGYANICEIGKERIRRAGDKLLTEIQINDLPHHVEEWVDEDGGRHRREESITKITGGFEIPFTQPPCDIGFRVLKLDDTNMKDVYYAVGAYDQNLLDMMTSNIKDDRTDMDLLYGCLLDWGLPLSLPHTREEINGVTVHTYNDGDFIACFADTVSDAVVKEIARRKPLRAVFRDSSFADSPSKINVEEIFRLLAPNTNVRVI